MLLTLALRYLLGHKLRTALTTLASVSGVAILFGSSCLSLTLAQSSRQDTLAEAGIQLGQALFTVIGLLGLALGGFVVFGAFRTLVVERKHDLATLRAVGATRRTILGLFLVESLIQGVLGTGIGVAAGYALAVGLVLLVNPAAEMFWHLRLGAPPITVGLVLQAAVLGVGVTLLAACTPARQAARFEITPTLRYE